MKENQRFVALNNSWTESSKIRANIPFPVWLDDDKVQMDLTKTERLIRLGGISHLRIEGINEKKKETNVIYSISGVGPDGSISARGSMIRSKNKAYDTKNTEGDKYGFLQNTIWVSTNIKVNMDQLQDEIMERGGNLRRPEDWAVKLDNITRSGIVDSGTKHLLRGHDRIRKAGALIFLSELVFLDAADSSILDLVLGNFNPHIPTGPELATEIVITATLWYLLEKYLPRNNNDYRFSLFPGYEIDRALLLQILGRTQKIILSR